THGGAKGKTATELSELLHMADSGLESVQWHAAVGGLLTQWNGLKDKERPEYMPELKIAVANRLFGDKGATFHANFLARTERDYGAPMELVDFRTATEPARQRINGWVEEQTYERIKDLVPVNGVDSTTRMVLVNAVYFKAQWMSPFQEMFTKDRPFLVGGETKTDVPTMSTEKNFAFGEFADDGVRVVELPYETGPFVMDILVPIEAKGLAAVEAKLDATHFDKWTGGLTHRKLDLQLPKFKLQPDGVALSRVLIEMGLVSAFGADADFTGMAPAAEEIVISEVFHKGFIEVNENGTEAAAATAVVARAGGMPPVDEPYAVHIDRPFAFVIRDTSTNAILFMGRVDNPA
ncbi:MAG: serpin family protein, partial [Myxococcota bacterium]